MEGRRRRSEPPTLAWGQAEVALSFESLSFLWSMGVPQILTRGSIDFQPIFIHLATLMFSVLRIYLADWIAQATYGGPCSTRVHGPVRKFLDCT